MASPSSLRFFILSYLLLISLADEEIGFNPRCPYFHCGRLGNIGFPFSNRTHPECGLCIVDNCNEEVQKIQLGKDGPWFNITAISRENWIRLVDQPFKLIKNLNNHSCKSFKNLTLLSSLFSSFEIPFTQNYFKCPPIRDSIPTNSRLLCNDSSHSIIYSAAVDLLSLPPQCSNFQLQVSKNRKSVHVLNVYTGLFTLKLNVTRECYDCHWKGGQCQSDSLGNFYCSTARTGNAKGRITAVVVALTTSGIVISSIILAFCFFRKKLLSENYTVFWKKKTKNYRNIEAFLKNYGLLTPKRYSYSDIKKMTNAFKHKLGQGGYGGVYKGSLLDGCDVAVKILNESKGNGEEFINEVASISRTSHINIVSLLGYCFEGCRRALIYEFVSNGSLEKFIYEKYPNDKQLKWKMLYQIALGIAQGLQYLHRDCNTRILHFDIKPHNILIDENFCPKISDFGLAKICPKRESIISMTGARGTIGYIAPEVFCRQFGEVSYKSDVYSYGMMVLEMIGGRKNIDVEVNRTSEIYFPDWIYERLKLGEELGLQGIENAEENESIRKMLIVSLWCIQTNPSSRPTMSRVVEMLEASLDSLQFPPKPFLSSPRSEATDSLPSLIC